MDKNLKKSLIGAVILLSIALTLVSVLYIRTIAITNGIDIDIKQKQRDIISRDSIIAKFKVINDSISLSNQTYILKVDSLKRLKHTIYITNTEQISLNPDQAYYEMIKELNKYKNEKSK